MWPAGWVSGRPEALEGGSQRNQSSWVPTASRHPWEIYKDLRRDPEEKEGRREEDLPREKACALLWGSLSGN